ncbi:MAG: hypothetical protein MI919_04920 [Holophagales bacterium]|nr:hypothetical protein [Holophagales bacterium]
MTTLAYFVSSHGFGHASRAAAVIEAVAEREPSVRFLIFTGTPRWFFEQSLGDRLLSRCQLLPWTTDVGLVQATAFDEDLGATVEALRAFLPLDPPSPFRPEALHRAARQVRAADARAVVADISPLGLAVAAHLGLPSALVENFTWDWIYRGYGDRRLEPFADALAPLFDGADLRLVAAPACSPTGSVGAGDGTQEVLPVAPIARRARLPRPEVRRQLGVPSRARLVLVTMGGVPWRYDDLDRQLGDRFRRDIAGEADGDGDSEGPWLVVAGGTEGELERRGRVVLLPHRSPLYHPDLVRAADAVVAKLGYSTVAEVAAAGTRLGFIPRASFPESPPVEAWVRRHLPCRRLEGHQLLSGAWLDHLDALLAERPTATEALCGGA